MSVLKATMKKETNKLPPSSSVMSSNTQYYLGLVTFLVSANILYAFVNRTQDPLFIIYHIMLQQEYSK